MPSSTIATAAAGKAAPTPAMRLSTAGGQRDGRAVVARLERRGHARRRPAPSRRRRRRDWPRPRSPTRGSRPRNARARSRARPTAATTPSSTALSESAARLRLARQVEQHRAARQGARGGQDAARVEAAVGHRRLLDHGIDAMGGGGEEGAVGRDEAVLERAPGLDHLRGEHDIDAAGAGIKREQRPPPAQRRVGLGKDLDVIGGGAGALRHARDRGRLHRQVGAHRRIDQPVGEHAAAFAAQGGDEDRGRARAHGIALAAGAARRCSQAMTAPRRRSSQRSQGVGVLDDVGAVERRAQQPPRPRPRRTGRSRRSHC